MQGPAAMVEGSTKYTNNGKLRVELYRQPCTSAAKLDTDSLFASKNNFAFVYSPNLEGNVVLCFVKGNDDQIPL